MLGTISSIVQFGLPDDYYVHYADNVSSMQLGDVREAAKKAIHPDAMMWVVVGDRAEVEDELKKLGEVILIDADGNLLEAE